MTRTPRRPRIISTLIEDVFRRHNVNPYYIDHRSNHAPVVAARRDAMIALRNRGYSLSQIGMWMGGMHHTTVQYHVGKLRPLADAPVPDLSGEWNM